MWDVREYSIRVSIPHRYGKNQKQINETAQAMLVSIPHRYGKNSCSLTTTQFFPRMFPFLIGTVRTWYFRTKYSLESNVSIPHRYGKNLVDDLKAFVFVEFPFLIGTVRTGRKYRTWDVGVSFHSS